MPGRILTAANPSGSGWQAGVSDQSLAIFDLDGTLTTQDTFLGYLLTFGYRHRRFTSLSRTPFRLAAYLARMTKDYRLKESLIRDFFATTEMDLIETHTRWFCEHWLPRRLHQVGTFLLKWHQERGDRVILLSASPEIAVPGIAATLGIEEYVCTRLVVESGFYNGCIDGHNCKGRQKVEAIKSYLQCDVAPKNAFAYGDSKSDLEILTWVDYGAWVRSRYIVALSGNDQAFPVVTV